MPPPRLDLSLLVATLGHLAILHLHAEFRKRHVAYLVAKCEQLPDKCLLLATRRLASGDGKLTHLPQQVATAT